MNYNLNKNCPCQSTLIFSNCCYNILLDHSKAKQAIDVLRARYSSYFLKNIQYIEKSMAKNAIKDFDASETKKWMNETKFIKLHIINQEKVQTNENISYIEYKATISHKHTISIIHETSCFEKINNIWYYTGAAK
jgi:SEC-C motif-containing protein